MEAYVLCAKDLFSKISTKNTGIRVGWINCVIFGAAFVFLSCWAVYGILHPYKYNPYWDQWAAFTNMFELNWFCYVYLSYCLLISVSGFVFIRGVRRSNQRKLIPFLLLSLIGIKFSSVFMETLDYAVRNYAVTNGISVALVVIHILSFIWTLTHFLQLRYTPEKLSGYDNVQQTL